MMAAQLYLPQVLVLVALSYATALIILVTRLSDLLRRKRALAFYEDFNGGGAPLSVLRPTRQLANQFEFPVLFYAAIAIAIAIPLEDRLLAGLAWAYVLLRAAHMAVHLSFNRLYVRTPLFMAGNFALLAMWLVLADRVLS